MKIGLTGGIASGKTTVANLFAALSVAVIDTDIIAREVVQPGQPALEKIVAEFGSGILGADGQLDRKSMRRLVFSDKQQRRKLESIVHPVIRKRMMRSAATAGGPYQILVVPLLLESGFDKDVDRVLVVDSPTEIQMQRLVARDLEAKDSAQRIVDAQIDRATRRARADDLIVNDSDLQALHRAVSDLDRAYKRLAK